VSRRRRAALLGAVLLAVLAGSALPAAGQAPDDPWMTLTTEHFRITYPEPLEGLARRAADRAESAWDRLSELFLEPPGGLTDILVTDHTDVSNGFARVTPDKRIIVFAAPPVDDPTLGFFDDWMELVITHEVVHIFHLDRPGLLGRVLRSVFGRVPGRWPFFPGFDTPRWFIEGIATWYESRLTESGRVHGTFHDAILRTALLEGRFEAVGQASGRSPVWPDGTRAYVYGGHFFEHLLAKHGEEKMAAFAEAVAGQWIPYRLDAAARDAFGASVSEEWEAWIEALEERWGGVEKELALLGPVTRGERLTPGSRIGLHARVGPDGRLAFSRADGRSDPQLRLGPADAASGRELVHTNGIATFDWLPGGDLLMSQLERTDPYRTYGDLYRVDGENGEARRLTRGARLVQPAVLPGGTEAVAVQGGGGSTTLVRVELSTGEVAPLVPSDPRMHWAFPAVSPDGRWVAVSRWTPGAWLDVVVLDAADGEVVARVTEDRAMDLAPAWSPDGRWLLWGSDRSGTHNVVAVAMDPERGRPVGELRMVTNVPTAAAYPSVAPASVPGGPWVYYSGYHVDGWEVERVPFEPERWAPALPVHPSFLVGDTTAPPQDPQVGGETRPYSPIATLLPRYWEPLYEAPLRSRPVARGGLTLPSRDLLGPSVGLETSGVDLVGRHAWDAFLRVHVDGDGRVDGGLSWSWAGLGNPVFTAAATQFWDERGARLGGAPVPGSLDTLYVLERERSVSVSTTLQRALFRSDLSLTLGAGLVQEHVELLDARLGPARDALLLEPASTLTDLRATVRWSTVRSYAFQTGGSDGASLFLQGRTRRDLDADGMEGVLGVDRSLDDLVGQVRAFKAVGGPGYASHVLALRASGGAARGAGAGAGHFDVGGASGSQEDVTGFTLFGGVPIFFPLRGYPRNARFGSLAWSASAEYRFPVALVHQGLGTWPLHVDRVMGSLFVDGGNAWGPELGRRGFENPRRDPLASVGAELTTDLLALWNDPLRLRVGAALPLVEGGGASAYLRLGVSF
jgi:Tol biopolymer transport system component